MIVSRVAGTMVARAYSVQVITHSNLSQIPPLLHDTREEVTGCDAGCQEVSRCSARCGF